MKETKAILLQSFNLMILVIVFSLFVMLIVGNSYGEEKNPEEIRISEQHKIDIVDSLSSYLSSWYVFQEVANDIDRHLRERHSAGAYDDIARLYDFTKQVNEDIQSVCGDKHLRIVLMNPELYNANNIDDPEAEARYERMAQEMARRSNYGFIEVRILAGNVGYIELQSFDDVDNASTTAIGAMNFVAHADALIIDLRKNHGGSSNMIDLLISYFFKERTHLYNLYERVTDSTTQYSTNPVVQGSKLPNIPIYVLTSSRTFSAAEAFAYVLQSLGRAKIVGEVTRGGAHPTDRFYVKISDEILISLAIPTSRAISPVTGTNWEGVGVIPDIPTTVEDALTIAHLDAVENQILALEDESIIRENEWTITSLRVELEPVSLNKSAATEFVGTYGPRTITLEEGNLFYQREGRPKYQLIPMGDDRFILQGDDDTFRIKFVRSNDGQVKELKGEYKNGYSDSNPRS